MSRRHVRLPLGRYLPPMGSAFVDVEVLGGVVLLIATIAALVWANVSFSSYEQVWSTHLTIGPGSHTITEDLQQWVNDGLMTIFFFVVGLEIKRELVRGELRDPRAASLPVIAAIGGMIVPALLYLAVNAGGAGGRGWAIPMATDIAFAVALLAIAGSRVPPNLKLFLLTLAIVDDIGAIVVIAVFYSGTISMTWLAGAAATVLVVVAVRIAGARSVWVYVLPALVLWLCVFESGVHATIAGVVLGLLTPARPVDGRDVIEPLEARLHPWSSCLIVPLFALANAGVHLGGDGIHDALGSAIAWGIVLGLVVGKPLGIVTASAIARRLRVGRLPDGVRFAHLVAAGAAAGIGFTVSLFVADLSYHGARLDDAKIGILAASVVSGAVGLVLLRLTTRSAEA
ncbi:MAG TPA: Na+/H+ antiporter NhaA [Acidimicrobiia bacterium]